VAEPELGGLGAVVLPTGTGGPLLEVDVDSIVTPNTGRAVGSLEVVVLVVGGAGGRSRGAGGCERVTRGRSTTRGVGGGGSGGGGSGVGGGAGGGGGGSTTRTWILRARCTCGRSGSVDSASRAMKWLAIDTARQIAMR
jgi:hypothetical protein